MMALADMVDILMSMALDPTLLPPIQRYFNDCPNFMLLRGIAFEGSSISQEMNKS